MKTPTSAPSIHSHRDRLAPPAGIVHLGLGNFHRAHQAVYTASAIKANGGDWGIVGVANRSSTIVDAMREQDMLYTVVEISPDGSKYSVPGVHSTAFVAAQEPERLLAAIGSQETKIITLTVTENGYTYLPSTGALNLQDATIQHDLKNSRHPRTAIGQIVRGLQERLKSHAQPVTILSCDNLDHNGQHTERLVREFAAQLPAEEQADLIDWLDENVTFPSSMVDRIVPATTDEYRHMVHSQAGYSDSVPVPAEPFSMWVIEDRFIAGRPYWEAGGVIFSSEVARYEKLKMRLLNGTHSLIAYLGALSNAATIPDSIRNEPIESAARSILRNEYLPSVLVPTGVDVRNYESQLFSRWRNTALGHKTSQVGSDGSAKLRQRIPEPALELLNAGTMPHYLALTVAGYLSCVAPLKGFDPGQHAAAMEDPARALFSQFAEESNDGTDLVEKVLGQYRLLGDELANRKDFIDRTGELIDVIRRHGPHAAIRDAEATQEYQEMGGAR